MNKVIESAKYAGEIGLITGAVSWTMDTKEAIATPEAAQVVESAWTIASWFEGMNVAQGTVAALAGVYSLMRIIGLTIKFRKDYVEKKYVAKVGQSDND